MLAPDLQAKLRHNAIVNIGDGSLFGFGLSGMASYVTIVPLFLSYLTESTALIGFVATLFYMGWQMPQLFVSNYVAGLRRYKPMTLAMTLIERVPYFGLALVAVAIPTIGADAALLLTLLLLGIQSLGGGFHRHRLAEPDEQDHAAASAWHLLRHPVGLRQPLRSGRGAAGKRHPGASGVSA